MKRLFDIIVSSILIVALSPLLIALAVAVGAFIGRPILFCQTRPGLMGKPFRIRKFRTMSNAKDADGGLLPDAERLTPFGWFLRNFSLDELPELFNVLTGDMSLVGPRPLLMEYLPLYSPEQARRHAVRPGLTGWAQVNGRNAISWEEKLALDIDYVNRRSMAMDLKILGITALKVLRREGINAQGDATMPRFTGNHRS